MAGIEPASKKFDQRYTTSLVRSLFSQFEPHLTESQACQPIHLWAAPSACGRPHPDLLYACCFVVGRGKTTDVTVFAVSGLRANRY